jgi:4-nitrophenyl phosphatase
VLQLPKDKKVYVIGEAGIEEELAAEGVSFLGGTDPRELRPMGEGDEEFGPDPDVQVVLVGLDRGINYRKLARAFGYLQNPETRFLATNIDSTFPGHGGKLFPGAGSMSAPLTYMTGKEPLSLGKPSQAMLEAIEGRFRFDKKRTCMVGDRINTDIRFGIEGGLGGTLGVLTGVSKEEEFVEGECVPEVYVEKLCDLLAVEEA